MVKMSEYLNLRMNSYFSEPLSVHAFVTNIWSIRVLGNNFGEQNFRAVFYSLRSIRLTNTNNIMYYTLPFFGLPPTTLH